MARMTVEVAAGPGDVKALVAERDELRERLLEAFGALGEVERHAVMALATALRDYKPVAAMKAPVCAALAAGGGQGWDIKTLHTNALAEEREAGMYWRDLAKSTRKILMAEAAAASAKAATKRVRRLLKRARREALVRLDNCAARDAGKGEE